MKNRPTAPASTMAGLYGALLWEAPQVLAPENRAVGRLAPFAVHRVHIHTNVRYIRNLCLLCVLHYWTGGPNHVGEQEVNDRRRAGRAPRSCG